MKTIALCLFVTLSLFARSSSAPYISGDGFRAIADFIFDETQKDFNPKKVQQGDVIFVKTDDLGEFFKTKHERIRYPYVLVSHNGDLPIPHPYAKYVKDPKILAWFGQNVEGFSHPKLRAIPIGIANQYVPGHGALEILKRCRERKERYERTHLLYLNINVGTNPAERGRVYDLFKNKPFCMDVSSKPFEGYLMDLATVKFVVSPRGNGLDCHRTWEALYMGAIPIVKSSSLDPILKDLPALIVSDWSEVTEEFLHKQFQEIHDRHHNTEKLYMPYWTREITRFKKK